MTVADPPAHSSRSVQLRRGESGRPLIPPPQFPLPATPAHSWLSLFSPEAKSVETQPKPAADVVDLLVMNMLDHPAGAAQVLPTATAEGGGRGTELLDSLVADHLERATHAVEGGVEDAADALAGEIQDRMETGAGEKREGGADLLQREIDALLAGRPSASAPVEPGLSPNEAEAREPLDSAELNRMRGGVDMPVASLVIAAARDNDEAASKMLEAEGVLAEELAQLMAERENSAEEPLAEGAPRVEATAGARAEKMPQRPPGVPEYPVVVELPDEEVEGDCQEEQERRGHRWPRLMNDVALVGAQLADMPFRCMDVMDKNLLGVAAAVLLLSGIILKVAAWWMGV